MSVDDTEYDEASRPLRCPSDSKSKFCGWPGQPFTCVCGEQMEDHELSPNPNCPACRGEGDPGACAICRKDWPLITSQRDLDRYNEIMIGPSARRVARPLPIDD
jgi:hypothetical protein